MLPANASPDVYPDNKNSHYRIKLPERVTLQGKKWSIALRTMHYANSWYNVTNGAVYIRHRQTDGSYRTYERKVESGRYLNSQRLVSEMRIAVNSAAETREKILMVHDENSHKFYIRFDDRNWSVRFSDELARVFDLSSTEWYASETKTKAIRSIPDIFAGHSLMYVYCSLVAPRIVGHSSVPLLMEVPVKPPKKDVENVFFEPSKPHYVPVSTTDTQEVEIDIRRGDGEPFLFRSGVVSVTVELREV